MYLTELHWPFTSAIVLTLLEVFILGHYGTPSTGRIQQLDYSTNHKWHKQDVTVLLKLLNKYSLLMVTFECGKNFNSVQSFKWWPMIWFDSKWKTLICTSLLSGHWDDALVIYVAMFFLPSPKLCHSLMDWIIFFICKIFWFVLYSAVRYCSDVSKNRFDLDGTSDKRSYTPRDANGRVKINGHNTVRECNF